VAGGARGDAAGLLGLIPEGALEKSELFCSDPLELSGPATRYA
jgi:hypothetical protein